MVFFLLKIDDLNVNCTVNSTAKCHTWFDIYCSPRSLLNHVYSHYKWICKCHDDNGRLIVTNCQINWTNFVFRCFYITSPKESQE